MVIFNKEDYFDKMKVHLDSSGCYKKLNKNPLNRIIKEVTEAIKKSSLDEETKKKLIISDPLVPRIYGLPKIHNPGVPLQPIVDTVGSPTYRLANSLQKN